MLRKVTDLFRVSSSFVHVRSVPGARGEINTRSVTGTICGRRFCSVYVLVLECDVLFDEVLERYHLLSPVDVQVVASNLNRNLGFAVQLGEVVRVLPFRASGPPVRNSFDDDRDGWFAIELVKVLGRDALHRTNSTLRRHVLNQRVALVQLSQRRRRLRRLQEGPEATFPSRSMRSTCFASRRRNSST